MGEMAESMEQNRIGRSQSMQSQMSCDAEPITPRHTRAMDSQNYFSAEISQDAIAGVSLSNIRLAPLGIPPRGPSISEDYSTFTMQQVQDTEEHVKRSQGSSIQQGGISIRNAKHKLVLEEKTSKGPIDDDSSYGSYSPSSMESNSSIASLDWERELEQYKDKMPTEVRMGYLDVVLLYTESDRELAEEYQRHLREDIELTNGERVQVLLYDCPELTGLSGSQIQHLDLAMERSTYIFVYLTANFVKDKWCEFSSESCLMRAIYDAEKRWCVVPIYTERRSDCSFRIPMGLNSLKGVNFYSNDEFYRKGVGRLISDKLEERMRLNDGHKMVQKEWLENHKREMIKVAEQKKRLAQQQEQMSRELRGKIQYLPDSELFHNEYAKYAESQMNSKAYSSAQISSLNSIASIKQQNQNVARFLQDYKTQFGYTTQKSYTQEEMEILSRMLQPEPGSTPDPLSEKFQRLNTQASSCSADMGVPSETEKQEVELELTPEMAEYCNSLTPERQQLYLESLYVQQKQRAEQQQSLNSLRSARNTSLLGQSIGPGTNDSQYGNQIGQIIPNFDELSINSQEPSLRNQQPFSHQSTASVDSSRNYSGNSSWSDGSETSFPTQGRNVGPQSRGNLPSALVEDAGSMVSQDCGSMYLNGTGNDNRVPARETVVAKSSKLPNDLDAEDDGAGDEDFEFVESSQSNKKGKVVKHIHNYYIMNPKAVQIGSENVIQDASGNNVEPDNKPDLDSETNVKVKNHKSTKDTTSDNKEDVLDGADRSGFQKTLEAKLEDHTQIHGEMPGSRHSSGTVVMDMALSSTASSEPLNGNSILHECKGELSRETEEEESRGTLKPPSQEPAIVGSKDRGAKPKIPAKPPNLASQVKPTKVVLPVRQEDLNKSVKTPNVDTQVCRPMAKIGPCIYKPNTNEGTDTDVKSVDNDQTCLKQLNDGMNTSGETHLKTVAPPSDNCDSAQTLVKTPYADADSEQTHVKAINDENGHRSLQDRVPIAALERSEELDKDDNEEKSQGNQCYQAPPFSVARHFDPSVLFRTYVNRYDNVVPTETPPDGLDSVDPAEVSGPNPAGLQEVEAGEDPLSKAQETIGFIPENLDDDDDIEYDMVPDVDEVETKVSSSTELQKNSSSNKLTRFFAKFNMKKN